MIVIMIGSPGSGKSTIASGLKDRGYVVLSCDQLREELFGDVSAQGDGDRLFKTFYDRLELHLKKGSNIVIDNTNYRRRDRKSLLQFIQRYTKDIEYWLVDTDLEVCLKNNSLRSRFVPEDVIHIIWNAINQNKRLFEKEAKVRVIKNDYRPKN